MKERTDTENTLCLLRCPSENEDQRITRAVKEGNNGTQLFLSGKTVSSNENENKVIWNLTFVLCYIFKTLKAH